MTDIFYSHPLKIPDYHTLSHLRNRSHSHGFPSITLDEAVQYLQDEMEQFPADRITIYSNYDHLNTARLRNLVKDDSAICMEITISKTRYYMVCDTWHQIEHNLYALHLGLRAIANMHKWGLGDIATLLQGLMPYKPARPPHRPKALNSKHPARALYAPSGWIFCN